MLEILDASSQVAIKTPIPGKHSPDADNIVVEICPVPVPRLAAFYHLGSHARRVTCKRNDNVFLFDDVLLCVPSGLLGRNARLRLRVVDGQSDPSAAAFFLPCWDIICCRPSSLLRYECCPSLQRGCLASLSLSLSSSLSLPKKTV